MQKNPIRRWTKIAIVAGTLPAYLNLQARILPVRQEYFDFFYGAQYILASLLLLVLLPFLLRNVSSRTLNSCIIGMQLLVAFYISFVVSGNPNLIYECYSALAKMDGDRVCAERVLPAIWYCVNACIFLLGLSAYHRLYQRADWRLLLLNFLPLMYILLGYFWIKNRVYIYLDCCHG